MILITGGTGFIGSHTLCLFINSGYEVIVLDNLSNSSAELINRVQRIYGFKPIFINGDICDSCLLDDIFDKYPISSVIHFAGLKSVHESFSYPLNYFINNVSGSLALFNAMSKAGVYNLVFSSSATVYASSNEMPVSELSNVGSPNSPYGQTKLVVENFLRELTASDSRWRVAILRYFNPIGAHESGLIGESPLGIPNNLVPFITKVASGKFPELVIFGSDYPTYDGTCIRDYIHVMDLADGHLRALNYIKKHPGCYIWNLGTGEGYSVLEVVRAFEEVSGIRIPLLFSSRRTGDIDICYSDPSKSERDLGWKAKRSLTEMLSDTWRWHIMNPNGY